MQVKTKEAINSSKLSELVAQGMVEKKASDVVVMDLREVKNAVADYFIICSGNSDTQIDAIADSIEDEVFKHSTQNPWKREGKEKGTKQKTKEREREVEKHSFRNLLLKKEHWICWLFAVLGKKH